MKEGSGAGLGLVTGVVLAVVGVMRNGVVSVETIHFPGGVEDDTTMEDEEEEDEEESEDACVLLVSGLDCGGPDEDGDGSGSSNSLKRELLLDYLTGHSTDPTTTTTFALQELDLFLSTLLVNPFSAHDC